MEALLTPNEVSKLLNVKPATVYMWVHRRQVPYQKVGGSLRFSPSALDKWLADQAWPRADSNRNQRRDAET